METTLHRQLKALYAGEHSPQEVTLGDYRIDVVDNQTLIEIQAASLNAIRTKIRKLVESHDVLVVKPLAARKYLIKRAKKNGKIKSKRYSPKQQTYFDVFLELVYFLDVFPHPRLTLEVLLTEQEELRVAKPKPRWRGKDYYVTDRLLTDIQSRIQLKTADDLLMMLPRSMDFENPFSTSMIAKEAAIPRWLAQKMAYCLKKTGAIKPVGKKGNSIMYLATQTEDTRAKVA